MELLRNRSFRQKIFLELLLVIGCLILNGILRLYAAPFILILGFGFILGDYCYYRKEAAKIAKISQNVDRILHGIEDLDLLGIDQYEEGELAILTNEIRKMTLRLKDQSELLKKDKSMLADAIADIFHQLRTPLTTLNLNADLLREEKLDQGRRLMIIRDIKKQMERIQWLVETLLKLSKIDAKTAIFEKKPISCKELLHASLQNFAIPLELKEIQVKEEIEDQASYIGDFSWSLEAISNLIKNCMEHTLAGGCLFLKASENAIYTEIIIEDNGEGFSKEDIPYLFERFYKGGNASENSILTESLRSNSKL